MTICPRCNGNGSVLYPIDYEQGLFDETNYDLCGGSGYVNMTNEEYLKSCTTEQLAEWIASVVQKAISIKESNGIVMLESAIWWDEWLKQLHSEVGK